MYLWQGTLYYNEDKQADFKEFLDFVLEHDKDLVFDNSILGFLRFAKITKVSTKTTQKKLFKLFFKPNLYEFLLLLYHAKVLRFVFPPFLKIADLAQFDGYHKKPVDLHLIDTVWFLEHIDDNYVHALYKTLSGDEKALLKFVGFFHDIGKGRIIEHSLIGAKILKNMQKNRALERS